MSLAGVADETLTICDRGEYRAPNSEFVSIHALVHAAVKGTVLHRPREFGDEAPVSDAATTNANELRPQTNELRKRNRQTRRQVLPLEKA